MLRNDAVRICQENNFNTGFFEGGDNNSVVDAYELKVMICSFFISMRKWNSLGLFLVCFIMHFYKGSIFHFLEISTFRSDWSTFLRELHWYLRLQIQRGHLQSQVACSLVGRWPQDLYSHCSTWELLTYYVCAQMKLGSQILSFLNYLSTKIFL